jgi:hypothetical protein
VSAMIGNPLLLPDEGYNISRSVRLRSSASAYFNRTLSSGSTTAWTWSGWVKRGYLGANQSTVFFGDSSSTNYGGLYFTGDALYLDNRPAAGLNARLTTTQVFRDPSAWYHIVAVWDTANATSGDRLRLYVNGSRITAFSTATYPAQNTASVVNTAIAHELGCTNAASSGVDNLFDGYLTEINFIDGQALTPSSFGETDAITGVWKPKKYTGTYGTNGFFLNFSDNSNNTAATIGKDYSGNGNNWTPNNISVTSGSTYDSMLDVPTQWADGGNGRGNYCTLNPLKSYGGLNSANLGQYNATANWTTGTSTFYVSTGKWYWEVLYTNLTGSTYGMTGIVDNNFAQQTLGNYPGVSATSYAYYNADGKKYNAGAGATYGATYADNDVIGIALDMDAGTLTFYKNGVSQGTAFTGLSGTFTPAVGTYGSVGNINFGQRPFSYTPPSGFKALNTLNLPAPTILKPKQFFDVAIYTTNGSTQTITTDGNGNALEINPNFLWNKGRNLVQSHYLANTITGLGNTLSTDTTAAESATGFFTSAGAGSFGVTSETSGRTKVNWLWAEGATQGFDIVTYTGTGSNTTVAHSLGVAPRMMIVKRRNSTGDWLVWHRNVADTGSDRVLFLNSTDAQTAASTNFNSTFPTSSVFSVGTNAATNASGGTYVAYLFSEVAGFSRFGSYTGNGSTDGPFVFCGFRPRWILRKGIVTAGVNWSIHDTARGTTNVITSGLLANTSGAETSLGDVDVTANGFKMRSSSFNDGSEIYIFAAFAEHPFKNALAR